MSLLYEARPEAGQKQRFAPGDWERATNKQQRRLVRAFDKWSAEIKKRMRIMAAAGASTVEQHAVFEESLSKLEDNLLDLIEKGIVSASRLSAGDRADLPEVKELADRHIAENKKLVSDALIPSIHKKLLPTIALGAAVSATALSTAFNTVRAAPAQYAGGYWVMIFDTQKTLGKKRELERISAGEDVEPIRWVIDPRAVHCVASSGHYGCKDLAGIYEGGWSALPTIPAGLTTCRGNCRCHLEVKRDGKWQRGVYGD